MKPTEQGKGLTKGGEYGTTLYGRFFKKYGFGVPTEDGVGRPVYVPSKSLLALESAFDSGNKTYNDGNLPEVNQRNMLSREALRNKAKDPKTLPSFTLREFDAMATQPTKCMSTFRNGVYDLTNFVKGHPGGDRVALANGKALESFFLVYPLHYRPHILLLLEDYRIGSMPKADARVLRKRSKFKNDFTDEPTDRAKPSDGIRVATKVPYSMGPRLKAHRVGEAASFYTPNILHFIRNHASVPRIEGHQYRLVIPANPEIGLRRFELTLEDIMTKFKPHSTSCALMCVSGRQEYLVTPDRPQYTDAKWRDDAVGNARWTGAKMRDVLAYCGLDVDAMALCQIKSPAKFVNVSGWDSSETGKHFGAFVPFQKCIDPRGDVILAYLMNGEILSRDHGYPIRMLTPGYAGCRSVKWIREIILTVDKPDPTCAASFAQHFPPGISFRGHYLPGRNGDPGAPDLFGMDAFTVCTAPVYSVITSPGTGQAFPATTSTIRVKGFAWSGGGRGIARVEVSIDGGRDFRVATRLKKPNEVMQVETQANHGIGRIWTWTHWYIDFPLTQDMKDAVRNMKIVKLEIVSRARDGDWNVQPSSKEDCFNVMGKATNCWSRRLVTIDPKVKKATTAFPMPPGGQWMWKSNYDGDMAKL